ncbi:unnamed protein product [marine sediment metagenome]|uniref:Uncharacterized protein n=1 Tax=marine sediment metagenome TaxID=412755 RepID=X1UUN7_9ZZZZ
MENSKKSITTKESSSQSASQEPEDICYSSTDILKDLKHWEHKAGFSKEITPRPGPYLDIPSPPWNHHSNTPPPPRDY